MKKKKIFICLTVFVAAFLFIVLPHKNKKNEKLQIKEESLLQEPAQLEVFRKCYPDVDFNALFDSEKQDWLITVTALIFTEETGEDNLKKADFWWADCRFLPEENLKNKDSYWPLIYEYSKLKDPQTLTQEEIQRVKNFSSAENRQNSAGTPMFFYDFLYAAKSQIIIEDHIVSTTFLGKTTKVHERIKENLKRIEAEIYNEAKTDDEINLFLQNLKSADAYNWRVIQGTGRKSFHSYGIAVDLLPKRLNGKAIFWSWTRDKNPENWMLTPLSDRWIPPQKIIDIFEKEGFIWGGNWIIFDNMHFEFHPELVKFKR